MKRRLVKFAFVFQACFAIALSVLVIVMPHFGVTKLNFDRIENGMTMYEVEAIFGRSPDDIFRRPPDDFRPLELDRDEKTRKMMWTWRNDDGSRAYVYFDHDHKVCDHSWQESKIGLCERIDRWIHWSRWRMADD